MESGCLWSATAFTVCANLFKIRRTIIITINSWWIVLPLEQLVIENLAYLCSPCQILKTLKLPTPEGQYSQTFMENFSWSTLIGDASRNSSRNELPDFLCAEPCVANINCSAYANINIRFLPEVDRPRANTTQIIYIRESNIDRNYRLQQHTVGGGHPLRLQKMIICLGL